MINLKHILTILLLLLAFGAQGQSTNWNQSTPVDLPETGWNKVLCMKNGNTLLFHFEIGKSVHVFVFDSGCKQVAEKKHPCGKLDINNFKTSLFKGLYDINDEAVLFIEQVHLNWTEIVRLRFNSHDGGLIEEKVLGESGGVDKPARFFVMKNKKDNNYAVLISTDQMQFKECTVGIDYYDGSHNKIKQLPLDVPRKDYDYMTVVGAESQSNGIAVTLALTKLALNGTPSHPDANDPNASVYDHYLALYYIPNNAKAPLVKVIDVTKDIYPFYTNYTYNEFAHSLNLLLLSYTDGILRNGIDLQATSLQASLFLKFDEYSLDFGLSRIRNQNAVNTQNTTKDTTAIYEGLPAKMFTNENGLTTLISTAFSRNYNNIGGLAASSMLGTTSVASASSAMSRLSIDSRLRIFETYLTNIAITQLNDDGVEIWGTMLPFNQYFVSHGAYYYTYFNESKRWQEQMMFADMPPQVYDRQFHNFNAYSHNNNTYIIYNDYNENFSKPAGKVADTVFDFSLTNTVCYKVGRRHELTKTYLYGQPGYKEYKSGFIESGDYDDRKSVYASLIRYMKFNKTELKMAWTKLE